MSWCLFSSVSSLVFVLEKERGGCQVDISGHWWRWEIDQF